MEKKSLIKRIFYRNNIINMTDLYRIVCSIHGPQSVWSDSPVTQCPINANDYVNPDLTSIETMARICSQLTPNTSSTSSTSYVTVLSCLYSPKSFGTLHRIRILSDSDSGATSYSVSVYDATNTIQLAAGTFTNNSGYAVNDLGDVAGVVTEPTQIDIRLKVDGGTLGSQAYISQILFYSY